MKSKSEFRHQHSYLNILLALGASMLIFSIQACSAGASDKRPVNESPGEVGSEVGSEKGMKPSLIFLGDSITRSWLDDGHDTWNKDFARYDPVNLGIPGDTTDGVLYRLEHGELRGLNPRVLVLLIGTNDLTRPERSNAQIVSGIAAVLKYLEKNEPECKILLHAIFPRMEAPGHQVRERIRQINSQISHFADSKRIRFIDIGHIFLGDNDQIKQELMPDYLHLSPEGYKLWASAIEKEIAQLMK